MELSSSYILSQILVIIYYLLLMSTYQLHNRNKILFINFLALVVIGFSYFLLDAYTGLAMVGVGIIRNLIFYIDNKKYGKSDTIKKKDIYIIIFLTFILIVLSIWTYDGIFSLMSALATYLYTISIWQKSTAVYKFLGVPVSIAGVTYNIFIFSIFGIIFESITLLSAVIGLIREKRNNDGEQRIRINA